MTNLGSLRPLKQLIADRQKAFHCQNIPAWKSLKYKVQQEIKSRKTTYYKNRSKTFEEGRLSKVVENCKHHGGKTGEKQLFQFLA
jgi:hypothetical protein